MHSNFNSFGGNFKGYRSNIYGYLGNIRILFIWIFAALMMGVMTGLLGSFFHVATIWSYNTLSAHPYLIALLPFGGIIITLIYKKAGLKEDEGVNDILTGIHEGTELPVKRVPLIFFAAVFSHLCGASVGRIGSTFQMGGSLGNYFAKGLGLKKESCRILMMCGMAGVFAAMFGVPIAGAIFVIEMASMGVLFSPALLPAVVCSLTARYIGSLLGLPHLFFKIDVFPDISPTSLFYVVILSVLGGLVSILYCLAITDFKNKIIGIFPNPYYRAFIIGLLLLGLSLLFKSDYNGLGSAVLSVAITGTAAYGAFFLKIVFTSLSFAAGYKGGEIYPALFVGATLGATLGSLLGFSPAFMASVGFICLFCSITNCPVTAFILSVELFGSESYLFYLIAIVISHVVSGYKSIYKAQKTFLGKYPSSY